jgi:hypothetical protein
VKRELATTLTNRRLVEAHSARAAAFAATSQAFAQLLDHFRELLVARLTANADAVFDHFACAITAREITLAHTFAVPTAAHAVLAARQRAAKLLQVLVRDFVVAAAINFATVRTCFDADFALRNLAAIRFTNTAVLGFQCGVGHDPFPLKMVVNL